MRKLAAVLIGIAILGSALIAGGAEIRLLGNRDLSWGSGTWVSTGGATVYRINADIVPFSADNAVKVGDLYPYALALDNGTIDYCMKWSAAGVIFWGTCGTGGSTTSLPWDNITRTLSSGVTDTELSYVDNVTSAIQTQLNAKAPTASPTFTGTVTIPTPFTLGATSVTATGTELNYLVDLTSSAQDQIDLRAPIASPTFTGTVTVNAPNGLVSDNVALTGGAINGIAIGNSTAADGTFLALVADNVTVAQGTTAGQLTLKEVAANGTEYRAIKAPDSLTDNVVFLLPSADPTANQVMAWSAPSAGVSTGTWASYTSAADPVFTGSVQLPNGANPTTDAAGEIAVDTSAGTGAGLRVYAHATYGAVSIPLVQTKCTTIDNVTATSDYPIERFSYTVTIKAVHLYQTGATNVIGQLDECDGAASCTAVDSSDITATSDTNVDDDGTLSNPGITAGYRIWWRTTSVSGTNTQMQVCFDYVVDAIN